MQNNTHTSDDMQPSFIDVFKLGCYVISIFLRPFLFWGVMGFFMTLLIISFSHSGIVAMFTTTILDVSLPAAFNLLVIIIGLLMVHLGHNENSFWPIIAIFLSFICMIGFLIKIIGHFTWNLELIVLLVSFVVLLVNTYVPLTKDAPQQGEYPVYG